MTELAILAWLTRSALEHGAPPYEVLDYLRNQERAATRLQVRRAGIDAWFVGRLDHPVAFAPRGTGMLPLALLLDQRGKRFNALQLTGEPCDVRALRARVVLAIEQLCEVEPAFGFLLGALHISGDDLSVSDLARHPRVSVDLG